MRNDSFSIKFFPSVQNARDSGVVPVYVRIIVNSKKSEITTRQFIELQEWDETIQRIKKPKDVRNVKLNQMESEIRRVYEELRFNRQVVSASIIKNRYLGTDDIAVGLTDYMNKFYSERMLGNNQISEGTVKNYKTTIRHLTNYLEVINQKKISLKEVNENFIHGLDKYLQNTTLDNNPQQTLKRNTINKYHCKIKAMLINAFNEGLIVRSPYINIKLKDEPTSRTFLTKPELTAIENHDLGGNVSLQQVRDIFLFSVYTGLRFADAMGLRENNIEFDGNRNWIVFQQKKTKEHCRLPVLIRVKEIYDKYMIECSVTGYLLPRITNQKVNAHLKVIAELAGLKKVLTHHVARHTSATTIFLSNGVPLEVVSKQLGHRSIKTTQIYAKITNEMLAKAADKIDIIFK